MPNYTWKCDKCEHEFENSMSFDDYDKNKNNQVCPKCQAHATRTLVMNSLITHYACGGFYDTESKTGSYRIR